VLERFVSEALTAEQVEAWANAVEMREDVEYGGSSLQARFLHSLANPVLDGALSLASAKEMLLRLAVTKPILGVDI